MSTHAATHAPAHVPAAPAARPWWHAIVATGDDYGATIARLTLALVMLPHGAQKALGWFGGGGFSATVAGMSGMGIPAPLVVLVIAAEFLGALGLLFGLLGRVGALGIAAVMAGATMMVHLPHGFFMNWMGTQKGEGFEYHLLAIGLAAVVALKGSGALSLDRLIAKK